LRRQTAKGIGEGSGWQGRNPGVRGYAIREGVADRGQAVRAHGTDRSGVKRSRFLAREKIKR
jgi:hypothetical protein